MGIGTSIFLIALGAILRWGVADGIAGINLTVIGLILMIAGVIGLLMNLLIWGPRRRATRVVDDRVVEERPVVEERRLYDDRGGV